MFLFSPVPGSVDLSSVGRHLVVAEAVFDGLDLVPSAFTANTR